MAFKKAYARIGVTIPLTEDEIALICHGGERAVSMLREILDNGNFELDGETYFPPTLHGDSDVWLHKKDFTFNL